MINKPDPSFAKEYFKSKLAFTTGPVELKRYMDEKDAIKIIDVRQAEHFKEGHIPGAVNLTMDKWDSLEGLDKGKVNIIYCYSHVCHLAANAAFKFAEKGYSVMELDGGFKTWTDHNMTVE